MDISFLLSLRMTAEGKRDRMEKKMKEEGGM